MQNICLTCAEDPTSHSFSKLCVLDNVSIYYTKPSAASKYSDSEGILTHIDNTLALNNGRQWSWTIDGQGFGMRHAMQLNVVMGILKLLTTKYNDSLVTIRVVNVNSAIKYCYRLMSSLSSSTLLGKAVFE